MFGALGVGGGAHRFAWELQNGPVPDGLQVDHVCRVRSCQNPRHLDVVTGEENQRRRRGYLQADNPYHDPKVDLVEKFWDLVDIQGPGDCWDCSVRAVTLFGKRYRSHCVPLLFRDLGLPVKARLARTCGNESCVNPWHAGPRPHSPKETCSRGHDDWYTRPSGGRECLTCKKSRDTPEKVAERVRRYRARKKEREKART